MCQLYFSKTGVKNNTKKKKNPVAGQKRTLEKISI